MIEGVKISLLKKISDDRGCVMRMVRIDDPWYKQFGEIYFSLAYPKVIKGWHLHKKMTCNYAVITGMIKLVLYDDRTTSPTRGVIDKHYIGRDNYVLVTIPPGIWNAFQALGCESAIVANCADMPHDPDEIVRISVNGGEIPYDWTRHTC